MKDCRKEDVILPRTPSCDSAGGPEQWLLFPLEDGPHEIDKLRPVSLDELKYLTEMRRAAEKDLG